MALFGNNAEATGLPPNPSMIAFTPAQFEALLQRFSNGQGTPISPDALGTTSPVKTPDSTRITPGHDFSDITSKQGAKVFEDASALAPNDKPLTATLGNCQVLFDRLETAAIQHGWRHFLAVYTSGNGTVQPSTDTPGGAKRAAFDLGKRKDLIKNLSELSEGEVSKYVSWYHGDLDQGLTERTANHFITQRLDLEDADPDRKLCAWHKYRLRCVGQVMYRFLEKNLTPSSMTDLLVKKEKFMYTCAETGKVCYDGLVVMYLLLQMVKPTVVVSVETLREKLTKLTLPHFGYNVSKLVTTAQDLRLKIIQEHGAQACDDSFFLTHVLKALATGNNKAFNDTVARYQSDWSIQREGFTDKDQILRELVTLHSNMVHLKTWGKTEPNPSAKLVSLTTQLATLEKKLKEQDKALTTMRSSSGKPDGTTKPGSWQTTKVGETTKSPDGKTFKWCPHHGKHGCYMPENHDHKEWEEWRKKKGGKKRKETKQVTFKEDGPTTLRLNQKLKAALVTNMFISEPEFDAIAKDIEAEVDAEKSSKD